MTLDELRTRIPDYAKDLRLNLESVLGETGAPGLTAQQVAMTALASAIASRHAPLTAALSQWAAGVLGAAELQGARTAAAVMGMTNVYYRFTHLVGDTEYARMRAGLRMNALANPGCEKAGFELASLAVSAVNGCGMCIDAHERELKKHGVTSEQIQAAVRIAAVVHAVAAVLDGEVALDDTLVGQAA